MPSIHLSLCKSLLKPDISVASEDVSVKSGYGAFTGELTAAILLDSGISWAIIGHSERRCGFNAAGESDTLVGEKTKVAIDAGMKVIVCIGEDVSWS